MRVIARASSQPAPNLAVFVGDVVVDDQVYVELVGNVDINVS